MAAKIQLVYFLLIICVIGSIECGLRRKRQDEPKTEEIESPSTDAGTEVTSETSSGGTGYFPFIPEDVQTWFGEMGNKLPGGGPSKWMEQTGANKWIEESGANKWVEDANSFFSNPPWTKTEE